MPEKYTLSEISEDFKFIKKFLTEKLKKYEVSLKIETRKMKNDNLVQDDLQLVGYDEFYEISFFASYNKERDFFRITLEVSNETLISASPNILGEIYPYIDLTVDYIEKWVSIKNINQSDYTNNKASNFLRYKSVNQLFDGKTA